MQEPPTSGAGNSLAKTRVESEHKHDTQGRMASTGTTLTGTVNSIARATAEQGEPTFNFGASRWNENYLDLTILFPDQSVIFSSNWSGKKGEENLKRVLRENLQRRCCGGQHGVAARWGCAQQRRGSKTVVITASIHSIEYSGYRRS